MDDIPEGELLSTREAALSSYSGLVPARPRLRRLFAMLAVAAVPALPALASASIVTDDPSGFLRDRETPAPVHAFSSAATVFSRELICAEDCVVDGRLVIGSRQAALLGLATSGHRRWTQIARFRGVRLAARSWKTVDIDLRPRAEQALRRWRGEPVRIYGQAVGVSLQSPRHGRAGWVLIAG